MLYPECSINLLAKVYHKRVLPTHGRVLRQVGEAVMPGTVIAEADVPQGYRLLDLERILGVRVRNMDKVLVKKVDDAVEEGEVIARAGVLSKAVCVSPVTGRILDARDNRVLIEVAPRRIDLTAFYPGRIVNLLLGLGAVIETTGALVQGVWGTGKMVRARLESIVEDGGAALTADLISAAHMGTILVGGRTFDREALDAAVYNEVRAVIVGSIGSELRPLVEASSLALMVTEGFGDFPMNASAFDVLHSYTGREACFSPTTRLRWEGIRPEVVIPLSSEEEPSEIEYGVPLEVGTRVRKLRAPHENALGWVASLPSHPYLVESGIRTLGAEVELDSVGKVFVPLENLERIR